MNNHLSSIPVGRIIQNENTPARDYRFEHYLIPYYQRGYRWDEINVTALLEDIDNFIPEDHGKYCLQPIVVVPGKDEQGHNIWEVVDGQQRLITLFIIFKVINKKRHKIIFQNRGKSTEFLENLSLETISHEEPDFHFMSQAYEIVSKWFNGKMQNDVSYDDDFYAKITRKVEVIWYQVNELESIETDVSDVEIESKKIQIFNRLNIGKIPLTDAELIRALLLSKIRYGLSDRESIMRQTEISAEWHRMEMELRDDKFWYFLNNKNLDEISSTIELIFKLQAKSDSTNYSTYLWFEKKIKDDDPLTEKENAIMLWTKTKAIFTKFKYWYSDVVLYHHIGYILAQNKTNLSTIQEVIDNSDIDKESFKEWAVEKVINDFNNINFEDLSFENDKASVVKVFLLFNILSAMNESHLTGKFFPFHLHKKSEKKSAWSIAHIHAQNSEQMKNPEANKKWLEDTLKAIQNIKSIEVESIINVDEEDEEDFQNNHILDELKFRIKQMLLTDLKDFESFNILKDELLSIFDSGSIHVMDNLALLSVKHNAALNNAIFPVKRNRILDFYRNGEYIPQTTINVFLKYYSVEDLQPFYWSLADKKDYLENIRKTLSNYIS